MTLIEWRSDGGQRKLGLIAAFIAALALSACGRAGSLELPPGPAAPVPSAGLAETAPVPGSDQDTALKTGFDSRGNPVATPGEKRTFILDPLLH